MELKIGEVVHYFSKISVAAIKITDGILNVGDEIHIKGRSSDFNQKVESMQIENKQVSSAKAGDSIGIKVKEKVREGDVVYKITE